MKISLRGSSEGTNLWFDNTVIPKRLVTRKARMSLSISCCVRKSWRRMLSMFGYATPIRDAQLLPEDITSDESFYPSEEAMEKMEVYDLGTDPLSLYNDPL